MGHGVVESSSAVRGVECWVKGEKGAYKRDLFQFVLPPGNNAKALVSCRKAGV
jgi:hypothetical protein